MCHMTLKLDVAVRAGSAAALRKEGKIPAVVYGPKHPAQSIMVDRVAFVKVLETAGESTILNLEGLGEGVEVLIHDVAFDAAKGGVTHADFYAIERGKELTTNVPLHFIGEAPITKTGATVTKNLHEIEVTCRPSKLPSHIDVDLSVLTDVDANIAVKDLAIPADVTVETDGEIIVASVSEARVEEEVAPEAAPAA